MSSRAFAWIILWLRHSAAIVFVAAGIEGASAGTCDDPASCRAPEVARAAAVDFRRHVLPLVSKLGCNTGNCHGSFQGRGGFRLSLFGHSAEDDYQAIVDRVDTLTPGESLLYAKATRQTDHGGGQRLTPGSWEAELLLDWIRQGALSSPAPPTALPKLAVVPPQLTLTRGQSLAAKLEVQAQFGDDLPEDVTRFCRVESSDPGVIDLQATGDLTNVGDVSAIDSGMAHLIVSYGGEFATVPVLVPFPQPAESGSARATAARSENPTAAAIDEYIQATLANLKLEPSTLADDAQFLRRATLDVLGRIPSPEEIRAFLGDQDPHKRSAAIERLLADPQHASVWATRLCDITGCRLESMEAPDDMKQPRARMWHAWFRHRLQDNMPIDRLVHGILCGTSRGDLSAEEYVNRESASIRGAQRGETASYADRPSLDLYWRRSGPGGVYPREEMAERTAAAFLGIRIECARCHKHPHDRWTQGDYASFVNVFSQVSFGSTAELNGAVLDQLEQIRRARAAGAAPTPLPRLQEVFNDPAPTAMLVDQNLKQIAAPRLLGGRTVMTSENGRDALALWLLASDNPHFARNWVNRVWAHYFGRGLIEPVDGASSRNPPSHPELLEHLARTFVESGFDMRALERAILNSHAYQRATNTEPSTHNAARYYACGTVRPLQAEAMVESASRALGATNDWSPDLVAGETVWNVASSRPANSRLAYLLELFGRGQREFVCDCGRARDVSLRQTLHQMSDAAWFAEIQASPLVTELTGQEDVSQALEAAFLRTVSRPPSPAELEFLVPVVTAAPVRRTAWVDVTWALLNSREFRTNH